MCIYTGATGIEGVSKMANHIFILAAVMMIAGVFGGLINFYQMSQDDNDPASLPRCIVIGIGAAFLVPVVLNLVNSDLILEIQGDPSRLLIYNRLLLNRRYRFALSDCQ